MRGSAARWAVAGALVAAAVAWWWSAKNDASTGAERAAAAGAGAASASAPNPLGRLLNPAPPGAASSAPFSAAGWQQRQAELALWRERLDRANAALEAYRHTTRYPHGARPATEQPDQLRPNDPLVEDHPLREPKGQAAAGVRLRTSQERVFAGGDEAVRFTVAVLDETDRAQPLRVQRAALREVTLPNVGSLFPVVPAVFNDDGVDGDAQAGDRIHTTRVLPSAQGFASLAGQLRLEVFLEYKGQVGFTYFDLYVTPEPPATWAGPVRESMAAGSLAFDLPVQVREPGRYVATGVVDDASGKPFALLTFNDTLAAGAGTIRLLLFGKLVRDAPPAFPLTLRDVVGFRLREEGHPDRALMQRRAGVVHASARHAAAAFSDAEWTDEQRTRYLAELTKDVDEAKKQVERLGP